MVGLQQVQDALERVLGARSMPFHETFWRGKNRDELVNAKLFNVPLFVPGNPEQSNIIKALQRDKPINGPSNNSLLFAYFSLVKPNEDDLGVIIKWIIDGCPEEAFTSFNPQALAFELNDVTPITDDKHVEYWRNIDIFFLPGLCSQQTLPHVIRLHGMAFQEWIDCFMSQNDPQRWIAFLKQPETIQSFQYIRLHQRRLIHDYYGDSQSDLFDSLWKFGGSLLPLDPLSKALPEHRMNGVLDWFNWIPYLNASLMAEDIEAIDLSLARAWQVGIIADGLLRHDDERPVDSRMPIGDFLPEQPDLFSAVTTKYEQMDSINLLSEMLRRAKESTIFG